jgi:hypothetical protein
MRRKAGMTRRVPRVKHWRAERGLTLRKRIVKRKRTAPESPPSIPMLEAL